MKRQWLKEEVTCRERLRMPRLNDKSLQMIIASEFKNMMGSKDTEHKLCQAKL